MPTTRLKLLVLGAIGVLSLVVIALAVAFVTVRQAEKPATTSQIAIAVTGTACTPNNVTVAAGTPDFAIHNSSDRAIEWEILNGVMVVAERENILPGFTVELASRLDPGIYQMTCGLLSSPRGTLTVTAANGSTTAMAAAPSLADLVAPTAEYRVYAIRNADDLVAATAAHTAALKAGDLAGADTHARDAAAVMAHLAPIVHLLAAPSTLPADAGAAATNAVNLAKAVRTTTAPPREIIAGAGATITSLVAGFDSVATATAQVAGVRKIVDLFEPLTLRADKALANKLDTDLAAVESALVASGTIPSPALKAQLTDLAADFTDLLAALGLNTLQGAQ